MPIANIKYYCMYRYKNAIMINCVLIELNVHNIMLKYNKIENCLKKRRF